MLISVRRGHIHHALCTSWHFAVRAFEESRHCAVYVTRLSTACALTKHDCLARLCRVSHGLENLSIINWKKKMV
jgi:hypothetical protein